IRNELGFIERSALQLTEIVDHVRKASAIRDGKIQLALASVALLEVFDATLSNFSRKLEEKNLQLHFDRERVKGFCVMADKTALTHSVIYNIVSNSIKFSEKGAQINLSVDATSEEQVCITIQDQGIGIPKSMLPVLFSSTSKTSRSGTIGEQGTGYGMPLVKAYVLLFNGKIEVDSVTNVENPVRHGTTIRITLAPGKSSRESIHDIGGRIV
ncbi:MAG: ATP-binding protein, partial [Proteobacteria bacterium]|nr:ATP-binding protein [Pseudomonadota bacterium]